MSRRGTVPLWFAGALIAALLVAWLLRTTLPAPPSNPAGTRIEWVEPAAAPLPTERVAVDAGADAAGSEPTANAVAAADRTITLRALLDDGRPAAGARVDVAALQPRADWGPVAYPPYEHEAKPRAEASFTTDTQGEVRLPWRHEELGQVPITVQHGVAFATTSIRATAPPGSTHEVQLATDQSLQVRVVDANDRPAPSVFVAVRATVRQPDGRDETRTMLAKARTDAAGSATFAHVQSWLAEITPEPTRTFEVYAMLPGGDLGATFDATALPREPVVLHVAPAGSIEVTALSADGTPLTGEMVGLAGVDTDSVFVAPSTAPVTTIAHVPLGQKWRAWVPGTHGAECFDGPRTAGETVKVTLRAVPQPVVVGRLLRAGSPLPNAPVSVHGLRVFWTYPTDAAGRFRLTPSATREPVTTIQFDTIDDQRVAWRATWRGSLHLTPMTHDLGDLHLGLRERGPRMVSGRVVAPCGLDSVRLAAFREEGRRAVEVEQDVTLKPDGTFVIYGTDPGEGLALAIESSSHLLEPSIPFAFGQDDVLVTLHAGVRLVASFPVESRQLARCLCVGLEAIRAEPDEDDDAYVIPPHRQSFDGNTVECAWDAREPGPYRLTVRFDEGSGKAVASTDVNLPANAREVRLPPLRVPDARLVRLQLPRPVRSERSAEYLVSVKRIVGDDADDIGVEDASGQWLLALTEPVDVRVHVPGYRARVLRAVFADTTVILDPAIPMDLIVEAPGAPDGATINVNLGGKAWLDAPVTNGRASLLLPDAGEYSIEVRVGLGWADMEEWSCEPDTINVPEHGGTFTVAVRPGRK